MPKKGVYKDLTGIKFNRLTVIELAEIRKRTTFWKCECDCGNTVIVSSDHLKTGHTKSCGCLNRERIKMQNYKNGLSNSKLHYAYYNMCNRCNRKDNYQYNSYGGRGIAVCEEWIGEKGFINFAEWALKNGYSEELTIDRIDNDKGYSPDNCRWVDKFVQANNKRNNRYVKVNGDIGTVSNMARKYGIDYWNLMHYAKGGQNCKYPNFRIEVTSDAEIQEYCKSQSDRKKERKDIIASQSGT